MVSTSLLVEKRWSCHASAVQSARHAVRAALIDSFKAIDLDLVELAVGEACANAVEHGAPSGINSEFVLRCYRVDDLGEIIVEVEDSGALFDLDRDGAHTIPDLVSEGGRGLFLINQIMDNVAILDTSHGLTLRMTKSMNPSHLDLPDSHRNPA